MKDLLLDFKAEHYLAVEQAKEASQKMFNKIGGDKLACGFAWVKIFKVRSNSKFGKLLQSLGYSKAYGGGLMLWNPSGLPVQNVDIKEAGAEAYCRYLKSQFPELSIYAGSRLD